MEMRVIETEPANTPACLPYFSEPAEPTHEVRKSQGHGHRHHQIYSPIDREPQTHGADHVLTLKLVSAGFSFFVAGVNDGSVGALIPYFMREYGISTTVVSTVFISNFLGWLSAAISNTHLSQCLDLGAMLALGAACQAAGHALRPWGPPFALLVFSFWLITLGQAYQDAHANTFVVRVGSAAHHWLGFIHAMYMAGCLVAPFVATAVASSVGVGDRWHLFYVCPLGLGLANLVLVLVAFRDSVRLICTPKASSQDALPPDQGNTAATPSRHAAAANLIKITLCTPAMWLLSLFFFFFLGAAITAGGWLVEYLVVVRGGELAQMGYVPAGFNGGCLLGRLLLPEPTKRFGERRMIFLYAVLCVALQLLFWLVPNIIAASIAVSFLGFFSGPFFATGVSVGSKLFSPEIHSTALAFVFVLGQLGGSLFPIVTGILATRLGVAVLQPILVALLVATAISWLLIPKPKSTENTALHQD